MRKTARLVGVVVSCSLFLACGCDDDDDAPAVPPAAFNLTGTWKQYHTPTGGSEVGPEIATVTQVGSSLSIYDGSDLIGTGTISGNVVTLSVMVGPGVYATMTGTATSADHIEGTYVMPGETGTFRLERV